MTLKKSARLLFAFSFVAIFGGFLIESESQAQYFRRPPGQELGRFLGLGYGINLTVSQYLRGCQGKQ